MQRKKIKNENSALCRLHSPIGEESYNKVLSTLSRCEKEGIGFIILHINSPGGEMLWAVRITKLLHSCYTKNIETISVGYKRVHSAALLIYMHCIYRIAYHETKFLIHHSPPMADDKGNTDHKILEKQIMESICDLSNIEIPEYTVLADANTFVKYEYALVNKIVNFEYNKQLLASRYK